MIEAESPEQAVYSKRDISPKPRRRSVVKNFENKTEWEKENIR